MAHIISDSSKDSTFDKYLRKKNICLNKHQYHFGLNTSTIYLSLKKKKKVHMTKETLPLVGFSIQPITDPA